MTMREKLIEALIPNSQQYLMKRVMNIFEISEKTGRVIFTGGRAVAYREIERLYAAARLDAVLAILSEPTPEMMRAACETMRDGGLNFHHPDDGDLDDLERHNFETLHGAIVAAIRKAGEM